MFFYYIRLYVTSGTLYGMALLIARSVGAGWYSAISPVYTETDRTEILHLK